MGQKAPEGGQKGPVGLLPPGLRGLPPHHSPSHPGEQPFCPAPSPSGPPQPWGPAVSAAACFGLSCWFPVLGNLCSVSQYSCLQALLQTRAVCSAHCQHTHTHTHARTLAKGTSDNGIHGQTPVQLLERPEERLPGQVRSRLDSLPRERTREGQKIALSWLPVDHERTSISHPCGVRGAPSTQRLLELPKGASCSCFNISTQPGRFPFLLQCQVMPPPLSPPPGSGAGGGACSEAWAPSSADGGGERRVEGLPEGHEEPQ